jgi:DNA polymerase III epsilon subunit-like protein
MRKKEFFIDTETTSVDTSTAEIIELALIHENKETNELFNPEGKIEPGASAVNGLTKNYLKTKPSINKSEIINYLKNINNKNNLLIAHNSQFDKTLLNKHLTTNNNFIWVDTLTLSKHLFPNEKSYKLGTLVYSLELHNSKLFKQYFCSRPNFHTALEDTKLLKVLFEHIKTVLKNKGFTYSKLHKELIRLNKEPVYLKTFYFGKTHYGKNIDILIKEEFNKSYKTKYFLNNILTKELLSNNSLLIQKLPDNYISWFLKNVKDNEELRYTIIFKTKEFLKQYV